MEKKTISETNMGSRKNGCWNFSHFQCPYWCLKPLPRKTVQCNSNLKWWGHSPPSSEHVSWARDADGGTAPGRQPCSLVSLVVPFWCGLLSLQNLGVAATALMVPTQKHCRPYQGPVILEKARGLLSCCNSRKRLLLPKFKPWIPDTGESFLYECLCQFLTPIIC